MGENEIAAIIFYILIIESLDMFKMLGFGSFRLTGESDAHITWYIKQHIFISTITV